MTRVHEPNREDWHNFMQMMSFMKTTQDDLRTVGADDLLHMLTMTDSAHAIHDDMRGQRKGRDYTKLEMLECGQQSVVITISSVLIFRSLVVMSTLDECVSIHHKIFLQTNGSQTIADCLIRVHTRFG